MTMHDLGYRDWDADAPHQRYSWLTISRYGARLAWKSQWLKRIIYLAFMPFFGLLASVFVYEQVSNWPDLYEPLFAIVETLEESQKDPIEQSQQGPGPCVHLPDSKNLPSTEIRLVRGREGQNGYGWSVPISMAECTASVPPSALQSVPGWPRGTPACLDRVPGPCIRSACMTHGLEAGNRKPRVVGARRPAGDGSSPRMCPANFGSCEPELHLGRSGAQ